MKQVLVWDLSTRLFHWLLVVAVLASYFTGEERGLLFLAHVYTGYVALLLVLFRLGWGVFGSAHSRFTDFVYSWRKVGSYCAQLLRLKPPRYVGHNPLGGWMVLALLAVIVAASVTGMFTASEDGGGGPYAGLIGGEGLYELHETLGNALIVLVVVHVLGVVADWILTRENLVAAMITGRKHMDETAASREPATIPTGRSLPIVIVVLAIGVYLLVISPPGPLLRTGNQGSSQDTGAEPEDRD